MNYVISELKLIKQNVYDDICLYNRILRNTDVCKVAKHIKKKLKVKSKYYCQLEKAINILNKEG